jgi:hypothetical protein
LGDRARMARAIAHRNAMNLATRNRSAIRTPIGAVADGFG